MQSRDAGHRNTPSNVGFPVPHYLDWQHLKNFKRKQPKRSPDDTNLPLAASTIRQLAFFRLVPWQITLFTNIIGK